MKLVGLELYRYSLPLTAPLSPGAITLHRREGILIRLTGDDGTEGWGEASPLPGFSEESLEDAAKELRGLKKTLVERAIPADCLTPGSEVNREVESLVRAPSTRFGVESAILGLVSAASGRIMPESLSCQPTETVWLSGLLAGLGDELLEEARRMREAGYRTVKLKVGRRSVEEDARMVRTVGEALGSSTRLRLDANRAWSLEEANRFARATADLGFEYIEEPLSDPSLLPRLVREWGVPVALDESLVGMEPAVLGEHGYARAIVLKPTLLGGVSRALRFADRARSLDITPVVSTCYETGIGTLGLLALGASLGGETPAGLDTYRRLAEDVLVPPLTLGVPRLDVREVFGVRRELRQDRLSLMARF